MTIRPLEERFWEKVDKTSDCWLWTASLDAKGYGWFMVDQTMRRAHGVAYRLVIGPVPDGSELDHLCRVRRCVNPVHLEPVRHAENNRRADHSTHGHDAMGAIHRAKTQCPYGHPYNDLNTYRWRGKRSCRTCMTERSAANYQRRKAVRHP